MNPIDLTAMRISMGLTISRKTAKNLAVRRKSWQILTVSCKKNFSGENNAKVVTVSRKLAKTF